jgi:hypothetical protein
MLLAAAKDAGISTTAGQLVSKATSKLLLPSTYNRQSKQERCASTASHSDYALLALLRRNMPFQHS